MSTFITEATKQILAFIDIIKYVDEWLPSMDDNKEILTNVTESVQKATESAFLAHGVTDMYVDISEMYIVDQIGNLENVMKYLGFIQLKNEELKWSNTKSDAEGIRHFIKADETLLRNNLVDRHYEIVNEYRWMQDCDSEEDRQFIQEKEE